MAVVCVPAFHESIERCSNSRQSSLQSWIFLVKPAFSLVATVLQVLSIAFNPDFAQAQPCSSEKGTASAQWDKSYAACSNTEATARPTAERKVQATVEIGNDDGGLVAEYALRLYEMQDAKQKVAFVGRCDSACTLLLALPTEQTCITEGAYFRFHAPSAPSASAAAEVRTYMMRKYPDWVRAWVVGQGGLSDRLATMSYASASKYMRTCS
jgi:hypothetical protein